MGDLPVGKVYVLESDYIPYHKCKKTINANAKIHKNFSSLHYFTVREYVISLSKILSVKITSNQPSTLTVFYHKNKSRT